MQTKQKFNWRSGRILIITFGFALHWNFQPYSKNIPFIPSGFLDGKKCSVNINLIIMGGGGPRNKLSVAVSDLFGPLLAAPLHF